MNTLRQITFLYILTSLLLSVGCTPQLMFQEKEHTDIDFDQAIPKATYEPLLKAGDKVTLSIWGHEELGVGSTFSAFNSSLESGKYLEIDPQGTLVLPLIGAQKIAGLSVREANLLLTAQLKQYIKEPIIQIRIMSHQATVIGEVQTPGNYSLKRINYKLLEGVEDAGGLSDYADKSKLTIIRTEDGKQQKLVFDLTDRETSYLQDIVLHDRDVIYVPERRAKEADKVTGRLVPIAGLIGSAVVLISVLQKN